MEHGSLQAGGNSPYWQLVGKLFLKRDWKLAGQWLSPSQCTTNCVLGWLSAKIIADTSTRILLDIPNMGVIVRHWG